jgi:aspartyl-tRNA(Asn)/glutamyl-tRNA(Gln) amidotransferase subunit B
MNSFRAVERALEYEADRQYRDWQSTGQRLGDAPKQTRGWDDAAGVTRGQRSKEESSDYRYFPDPDLVPVTVTPQQVTQVAASLGELPASLRKRLQADFGLSHYDADVLVNQGRPLVDYYLSVAGACRDGKAAANWVTQDVLRVLKEQNTTIDQFSITSSSLAELICAIQSGDVPKTRAREVFDRMAESGKAPVEAMTELGISHVDESELLALCEELLAANPKIVDEVREGKLKALGALIGQAKKKNPNVSPDAVRETCLRLIQTN